MIIRAKILHLETISMMTKYQLVFTKLEGHLIKVANTVNKYDYITNSAGNQIEKVHEKLVTDITLRTRLNKTVN